MTKTIPIERTKKGLPALWESGGGYSNTGEATIIAGPNGEKKVPLYVRRRGPLACAHHALFVVHEGDTVIQSSHHREDFRHQVYRIVAMRGDEAEIELIAEYSCGQWDTGPLGKKNSRRISPGWQQGNRRRWSYPSRCRRLRTRRLPTTAGLPTTRKRRNRPSREPYPGKIK